MAQRLLAAMAFSLCSILAQAAAATGYPLLVATKGGATAYFLPTVHQSNAAMAARLAETLRCLPEIGVIATEVDFEEAKRAFVLNYSKAENATLKQQFPADLVAPLDDLSVKVMPTAFPIKGASGANSAGIHPAHYLYYLRGRVMYHITRSRGVNLGGPAFEALLHDHARSRQLREEGLEGVRANPAAFFALTPEDVRAEANYLLRMEKDRRQADAAFTAYTGFYSLFEEGDWRKADIQALNDAMRATQSPSHVASVVVKRTQDMMDRFDALPKTAPVLVAIGMGHFGKRDGVEAELAARGYTLSERSAGCVR